MKVSDEWCPSGSVLGLVLFSVFINNVDSRIKFTLSRFVDDTKLCCEVKTPMGQDAIQRDLGRLEQRAQENFVRSNKSKCKAFTSVIAIPSLSRSRRMKG